MLFILERYPQNCQTVLVDKDMNGLTNFYSSLVGKCQPGEGVGHHKAYMRCLFYAGYA